MKIVIVGGGFGGVKAALELAKQKSHKITLISDRSYFQYYPALYSTATGHSHRESWVALSKIFREFPSVKVIEGEVTTLNSKEKQVVLSSGNIHKYDRVIFALGSVTTYFGIKGLDSYAFGIKSEDEIRRLQTHIWEQLSDGIDDEQNYVIIGAGPTGVELAGALGEYVRTIRKHFGIRKQKVNISLIEAAPRVLPRMSEKASRQVEARLKLLGIKVETNKKVEEQTKDSLLVSGKPITTQTVIWTSGVANVPFYANNSAEFSLNERGKVVVDQHMQASKGVYVIGDNAATPYAGLAQTALHDAIFVARHIAGSKDTYKSKLPASVIPVGYNWAIFEWGRIRFGGRPGAVMREAADIIGYHDILPISWALGVWRAGKQKQMRIPNDISK